MQKISKDGLIIISKEDLEKIKKSCFEDGVKSVKAKKETETATKAKAKEKNIRRNVVDEKEDE